jgi:hypothetical protein
MLPRLFAASAHAGAEHAAWPARRIYLTCCCYDEVSALSLRRHAIAYLPPPDGVTAYPKGALLMYGGIADIDASDPDSLLDDLWVLDFSALSQGWQELVTSSAVQPGPRMDHGMVTRATTVIVSGGITYSSDTQEWSQVGAGPGTAGYAGQTWLHIVRLCAQPCTCLSHNTGKIASFAHNATALCLAALHHGLVKLLCNVMRLLFR